METKDDCIFCKIIKGEIPSIYIFEDDNFKVILDKFPSVLGHTLVIPKNHADNIFDLDEKATKELFPLVKNISKAIDSVLKPDGINILQNNGEVAGQSVMHFHMHIIPRFKDDDIKIGWNTKTHEDKEFLELGNKIKENI